MKFWPDAVVVRAPPVKERPRCLACGKRLRPNYDTKHEQRRVERPAPDPDMPEFRVIRMVWRGTFGLSWGGHGGGHFCGLNCAARWACAVAPKLEERNQHWTLADYRAAVAEDAKP